MPRWTQYAILVLSCMTSIPFFANILPSSFINSYAAIIYALMDKIGEIHELGPAIIILAGLESAIILWFALLKIEPIIQNVPKEWRNV